MITLVLIAQFLVIFWLLIQMGINTHSLKERIDRASRYIEKTPKPQEFKEPEAICGCTHHHCFHNKDGCGFKPSMHNPTTGKLEKFSCSCKRYTGPEPLPTVIS